MPGLHIDRFQKGLVTNRAATSTPFRLSLHGAFKYEDTLIDGSNVEISPANTLVRRPGFPKYNSSNSIAGETPKGFAGAIINSTIYKFLDTDQHVYLFDSSSLTSLYTKGTTAQSFFQQVGNVLFWNDGNVCKKFTIGNSGDTSVTNNGLTTPPAAPTIPNLNLFDTVGATQTVHAWVPGAQYVNSTGSPINLYLLAPTGEIQWSVVPAGSTLTSQTSAPNWAAKYGVFGGVTTDGQLNWTNCGTIGSWAANTAFTNSSYTNVSPVTTVSQTFTKTTSGSTSNNWVIGSASVGIGPTTTTGNSNTFIAKGAISIPAGATVKGIKVTLLRASNRANTFSDVTVQLLKAGVAAGNNKAAAGYYPWTTGPNVYTVPTSGGIPQIYGANNDLWGTTWTPTDLANANFGIQIVINDNSTRTSVAAIVFPITFEITYTVASSDLTGTVYAQIIKDSNGNLQAVKTGGTTGGSAPSWSTTIGGTTTDGSVTWQCLGTANQLPCLFNRTYAFGFHATGSVAHLSTMSPTLSVQAPIIGLNVPIQGFGSDDTQVDRNDLYRSADGGSLLLYDTSAPNVNSATSWTVNDSALDSDLNPLLIGPVAHANDPPPAGATIMAYHLGRLWVIVGNKLYFSSGPDCINGDGLQSWPPANVFTLTGQGTGLASTSQGLVVFTTNDMSVVLGGPQTQTFWVQPLMKNFGVMSQNCIAQDGDSVYVYTTSKQLFAFAPGAAPDEIGFDVAPTLAANFDPSTSYLTVHRAGQDQGLFICDGSTKMQRYNLKNQSWDAVATVSNIGPIASILTASGSQSLVSTTTNYIVVRDPNTYADSGSAYSAYATVGSLVMSELGEKTVGKVSSILLMSAAVGTALAVGVLANEISGSFTSVPLSNSDPPKLSGTTYQSSTVNMKEYQWLGVGTPVPSHLRHLQVKITFPATDTVKNEVYAVALIP